MKYKIILWLTMSIGCTLFAAEMGEAPAASEAAFNADEYKDAKSETGLNLPKIYETISNLRKKAGVGAGELTVVTMYMAVKDKLAESVTRLAQMHKAHDEMKSKKDKAKMKEEIDRFLENNVNVIKSQVADAGERLMNIFHIDASRLAMIPGFKAFHASLSAGAGG